MTIANLTNDIPPKPYGLGGRYVVLPQSATAQIYQGAMVAETAAGALVTGTTAGSGPCVGVAVFGQLGGTTDGAVRMQIWTDKIFVFAPGTNAPTDATPFGTVLFMESDNQVGVGPGSFIAGRFYGFEDDGTVRVYISACASWFDTNAVDGGNAPYKARAVAVIPDAYGGSGTETLTETTAASGFGTQDGVTLVAGDVVFVQGGSSNLSAAKDSGPWVVTALGSATVQWVLTRPTWWGNGAGIVPGQVIEIGGEGTVFRGGSWKAMCAKANVIGTNDPKFYVGRFVEQAAFVTGDDGAHVYAPSVGVLDAAHSSVFANPNAAAGGTTTGMVSIGAGAITPGYTGTATLHLNAFSTGLALNTAASTLACQVTITNW